MSQSFRPLGHFAIAAVEDLAKRRMERAIDQLERVRFEQVEAERARAMIRNGTDMLVRFAGADTAADYLEHTLASIKE